MFKKTHSVFMSKIIISVIFRYYVKYYKNDTNIAVYILTDFYFYSSSFTRPLPTFRGGFRLSRPAPWTFPSALNLFLLLARWSFPRFFFGFRGFFIISTGGFSRIFSVIFVKTTRAFTLRFLRAIFFFGCSGVVGWFGWFVGPSGSLSWLDRTVLLVTFFDNLLKKTFYHVQVKNFCRFFL